MAQPIDNRQKLINQDGTPTEYFIRLLRERGLTSGAISNDIVAGTGLSGGGTLAGGNVTINLDAVINDLTDVNTVAPAPTNGQVLTWNSGTSQWIPSTVSGSGQSGESTWVQPTTSTFATQRMGTSGQIANYAKGVVLSALGTTTNTYDLVYALQATPTPGAAGWKATGRFKRITPMLDRSMMGIALRDSAGGRSKVLGVGNNTGSGFNYQEYTSDTVFSVSTNLGGQFFQGDYWLQVEDNLTNIIYRASLDGYNWQQIRTQVRTTWCTPNQVGFFIDPNSGTGTNNQNIRLPFACLSWEAVALP